jgi:hypothetical protein
MLGCRRLTCCRALQGSTTIVAFIPGWMAQKYSFGRAGERRLLLLRRSARVLRERD